MSTHIAVTGRLARIEYKRTRGRMAKQRSIAISEKLHVVHKPWYLR